MIGDFLSPETMIAKSTVERTPTGRQNVGDRIASEGGFIQMIWEQMMFVGKICIWLVQLSTLELLVMML